VFRDGWLSIGRSRALSSFLRGMGVAVPHFDCRPTLGDVLPHMSYGGPYWHVLLWNRDKVISASGIV